jgi:hypothetical protein
MRLFDFLKKKEQPKTNTTNEKSVQNENEPYLGDLKKTEIIYQLVQTPPDKRDEKWQQTFLANIGQASFRCGDPQLITGPDGLPYFQLFLPEPNKSFQCFVIEKLIDDFLLTSGYGVVINPSENRADWVLSYGDILNMHLNKTFYTTTENSFSKEISNETISENEEVMIGQPSESILPKQCRRIIAEFLKMNGVNSPKVLLLMRAKKDMQSLTQDIVFNLTINDFKDENTFREIMQTISWYLPRHYSISAMSENSFGKGFMPL